MFDWMKDRLDVLAFILSVVGITYTWLTRRIDWRRNLSVPRYTAFALASMERGVFWDEEAATLQPHDRTARATALRHAFNTAAAEVAIVGPKKVGRSAAVVTYVLSEWEETFKATGSAVAMDRKLFDRAINDFVEAASGALSVGYKSEDIDFAVWKALPEPERTKWPKSRS